MRRIFIKALAGFMVVIFFLLSLGAQSGETNWKEMETRLSQAVGEEKFNLLVKLTGYYSRNDPKKALSYGGKALELLKDFPGFPGTIEHVELLNALSMASASAGSNEEAQTYARQAREMAKKINDREGYAKAVYNLGRIYQFKSSYEKAFARLEEALEIFKEMENWDEMGKVFNMKGMIYARINDYSMALENFLESARAYEKLENKNKCLAVYNNIGVVYDETGDYDNALRYFNKAREIAREIDHKRAKSFTIHNLATIYRKQGKYKEALDYAKEAMKITDAIGDKRKMAFDISFIGEINRDMKRPRQAMENFSRAMELAKQVNERELLSDIFCQMGALKGELGQYTEAVSLLKQALTLAAEIKALNEERNAALELYKVYAAMKNTAKALEYHILYKQLDDKILNKEKNEKMTVLEVRFDFERKNKEIELLKKDQKIRDLQLRRHKNLIYSFIIISLLIMIAAGVIFNRYRFKARINRKLSEEIENHKKTACALRESEEKFRTMAEKSLVGIYIIQDNLFKYVNPRFLEIFGYTADEFTGRSPLEMVMAEDRPLVAENVRQRLEGEINTINYQFRGITKQGDTIFLESFGSRFHFQGKPAVIGTLIDITERRETEEELRRSQKLEAVGILAGGIAHDFNNLLSIIIGCNSILKETIEIRGNEQIQRILGSLEKASWQASDLANKLINLTSQQGMRCKKLSLRDILKRVNDRHPEVQPLMNDISIPADLKPVFGDERRIAEVIFNLLKNAEEATVEHGQVSIQLENTNISGRRADIYGIKKGEYVKVSIIDSGKGIPAEQLESIFNPYFSTKDTYSVKGMGLGLPICYSIIKRHGGYISIQSHKGRGTTVEFYIPVFK
jgi:PAS domain S-box-containing protein